MLTALARRRADPTRTLTLRTRYARVMRRRFVAFRRALRRMVIDQDAFGLHEDQRQSPFAPLGAWAATTREGQLAAFTAWLDHEIDADILAVTQRDGTHPTHRTRWQDTYLTLAYTAGLTAVRQQLRQTGAALDDEDQRFGGGLLTLPVHAERLAVLEGQAFEDLRAVTDAMRGQMVRAATAGLVANETPTTLADALSAPIDTVGLRRGEQAARTSVIGAVAAAFLIEAARQGVAQVQGVAEYTFTSSGDERVCPECADLDGQTFTPAEAEGVIPVHIGCRCGWSIS